MEYIPKGVPYLRRKLNKKRSRARIRYKFYEQKMNVRDFGISTPKRLQMYRNVLGWATNAVDSLADRLVFSKFLDDNFDMESIYNQNNKDLLFKNAILSALITSCCFVAIEKDEDGKVVLKVVDGTRATGVLDTTTNMLKEGYAILETDDAENPTLEAYYMPDYTEYRETFRNGKEVKEHVWQESHSAGYPLLVPIIYKPDAKREFGHSVITRSAMDAIAQAVRTVKRSEITAEFYSFPQKYALGLAQDVEFDNVSASASAMLYFYKDDEGESPKLGQFQAQSMAPHVEHLRMFAQIFAGETGLSLTDIGFVNENPASAESIKASHESLRLKARAAQKDFATGFLNVGFVAACLRDGTQWKRTQIYETRIMWEPIFEPDSSMLAAIGDGVYKINEAVPGYIGANGMHALTGLDAEE